MQPQMFDRVQQQMRTKYGFELYEEDIPDYERMVTQRVQPLTGCIAVPLIVGVVLFILMTSDTISFDDTSIIPLIFIFILCVAAVGNLQQKTTQYEKELIDYLNQKYANPEMQNPAPLEFQQTAQQQTYLAQPQSIAIAQASGAEISQAVPTSPPVIQPSSIIVDCPICDGKIPQASNPCPKCGAFLMWKALPSPMPQSQAPASQGMNFSADVNTIRPHK